MNKTRKAIKPETESEIGGWDHYWFSSTPVALVEHSPFGSCAWWWSHFGGADSGKTRVAILRGAQIDALLYSQ